MLLEFLVIKFPLLRWNKLAKLRRQASRIHFALIHFGKIHFKEIHFGMGWGPVEWAWDQLTGPHRIKIEKQTD